MSALGRRPEVLVHAAQTPPAPDRTAQRLDHRLTRRIAGRFIPLAIGDERETRALVDTALTFYGG